MSIETMTKLATVTVGSGGSANIDFNNIPQTYTDLKLVISSRDNRASQPNGDLGIQVGYNGVLFTGTQFQKRLYGTGSGTGSDLNGSAVNVGMSTSTTATANTFGNNELYFPNYSGNTFKTLCVDGVSENNATLTFLVLNAGIFETTQPITNIRITPFFGTLFDQYTTATLYGIKNMRTAAGNSVEATGGNITFDGTYVYHVFNSTGSFVPTQSLTADALVIAGGGSGASGGNSAGAGGGGAGGLLGFTNQSFSVGSSYVCTVGAGGAAVSQYGGTAANGNTGNDSQLASLTIAKGGGFGGGGLLDGVGTNGGNGGSGGGAGRWSNSASFFGGSPTSGQGFKGGDALSTGAGGRCAGGGGGAGQAGTNTTNVGTATGGNGVNTYESWARATNTGENGYYAGGGGGSDIGHFGCAWCFV
jgi:hypothetical protein